MLEAPAADAPVRDPCLYLVVSDPEYPGCHLGHGLGQCRECTEYRCGLNRAERQRCEVWTRVMGYHRPVSAFNVGKQAEHAGRVPFHEPAWPWPVGQFEE